MFYRLGKKNSEKTQVGVETTPLYVRGLIIYKLIAMAEVPGWRLEIASRAAACDVDIYCTQSFY